MKPSLETEVRSTFPEEEQSKWNIAGPIDRFTAALRKENIRYIDLYPQFLKEAKARSLYVPRDSHWNIAGNRLAAEIIGTDLRHHLAHD